MPSGFPSLKGGKELEKSAPKAIAAVREGGALWISYPKKSSKVSSDLKGREVRPEAARRRLITRSRHQSPDEQGQVTELAVGYLRSAMDQPGACCDNVVHFIQKQLAFMKTVFVDPPEPSALP